MADELTDVPIPAGVVGWVVVLKVKGFIWISCLTAGGVAALAGSG
jgi:hypothetical protein